MVSPPERKEISHLTIKLLIGSIAILIGILTDFFSKDSIQSISASYYETGWTQTIFIGFLFSIAALLLAYNGLTFFEMIFSKLAALAALGVALFPCVCICHKDVTPYVHGISATTMFLILAYFCGLFFKRATEKGHIEAKRRAFIYAVCGIAIIGSIVVMGSDHLLNDVISLQFPRLTFYGESTGLIAFGISWLTASRTLPGLSRQDERLVFFKKLPDS